MKRKGISCRPATAAAASGARVLLLAGVLASGFSQPAAAGAFAPGTDDGIHDFFQSPSDGRTDFGIARLGDDALHVDFVPSASATTEWFAVRLSSRGVTAMHDLTIRWEKSDLAQYGAPLPTFWIFGFTVVADRGRVLNAITDAGDDFYQVTLSFTDPQTSYVEFQFPWNDFNVPRSGYSMLFDLNGIDAGGSVAHAPLPGALWLLASALLGGLVLRRIPAA